ncbi:MAG: WD40 repeat domain-containing protein, partial [Planctomycetota bacterium]
MRRTPSTAFQRNHFVALVALIVTAISSVALSVGGVILFSSRSCAVLQIQWARQLRTRACQVVIDGERLRLSDANILEYRVLPATHLIELRRPGFQTFTQTINVAGGQTRRIVPKWKAMPKIANQRRAAALLKQWPDIMSLPRGEASHRQFRKDVQRMLWTNLDARTRNAMRELRRNIPSELSDRLAETMRDDEIASSQAPWMMPDGTFRHSGSVTAIAFSRDGRTLYSAGTDGLVRVWSMATGQSTASLMDGIGAIECMDLSRDNRRLIVGGSDGWVRIWDLEQQSVRRCSLPHGKVTTLKFSNDGNHFASGGADNRVRIWNAKTLELEKQINMTHYVGVVRWGKRDTVVIASDSNGIVKLWDIPPQQERRLNRGPPGRAITMDPDTNLLSVFGANFRVATWDLNTPASDPVKTDGFAGMLADCGDDGWLLMSVGKGQDQRLRVESTNQHPIAEIDSSTLSTLGDRSFTCGTFHSETGRVALGNRHGELFVLDTQASEMVHRPSSSSQTVTSVALSLDGGTMAIGFADGSLATWDVFERREISRFQPHKSAVLAVAFGNDDRVLVSADGGLIVISQTTDLVSSRSLP